MSTVDNNCIVVIKNKRPDIAIKRKINKDKLLLKVMYEITENMYDYDSFIKDLLYESLSKRTQKELKEILYGGQN